jgi:hypothetical protein
VPDGVPAMSLELGPWEPISDWGATLVLCGCGAPATRLRSYRFQGDRVPSWQFSCEDCPEIAPTEAPDALERAGEGLHGRT